MLHTKAIQEVDSYHELCEDLVSFEYYYSIPNPIHVRKILGQLLDAQLLSVRAFIIISLLIESAGTKFSNNDHLFNYYDYYDEKSRFNLEQKRMLNSLLDKGIKSMNDTLNPLYRVSESVKEVLEELISLHKQFKIDSDDKSDYFQSELSGMRSYAFDSNVRVSELNRGSIGHDRFLVSELKQELNKVKHQFEDFQNKLELAYSGISLAIGKIESQIMIFGTLKNEIKRFYSWIWYLRLTFSKNESFE